MITGGARLAVCALGVSIGTRAAFADGETTPMVGLAVVAADSSRTVDHRDGLAGIALDIAWWHGAFGLAAETSARWSIDSESARAVVVGVSARVRVLDWMMPSLLDPRDVELGLEVQAIAERTWWNLASDTDPSDFGFGLALRVRGSGDPDDLSTLLAESRFFVRVTSTRWNELDAVRTTAPVSSAERPVTVLVGIGASFGSGTRSYVDRFRTRSVGGGLLW